MSEGTSAAFQIDRGAPATAIATAMLAATPEAIWEVLSDIEDWPAGTRMSGVPVSKDHGAALS